MTRIFIKRISLLAIVSALSFSMQAQGNRPSSKEAKRWYKKTAWQGDFRWKAHRSINRTELAYQYAANKRLWDTAFAFLATRDLATLEKGDYPLAGDSAVVKVSYSSAKEEGDARWEFHRRMIDLQLVGSGTEKIGVAPVSAATVTVPYDSGKDIANVSVEGKYVTASPGTFFIFFPADAHRPGIKVNEQPVRKIVVKIIAAQ